MLEAALAYAARGWSVVPCRGKAATLARNDKGEGGARAASADAETIRRWFTRWPDANLGIVAGPSGLLVLDIDTKGGDGHAELLVLEDELGPLPPTYTVRTPSGGAHYYFTAPRGVQITASTRTLAPHIDIRAGWTYVVAPPSAGYELALDVEPAELPAAWIERLRTPERAAQPEPPRIDTRYLDPDQLERRAIAYIDCMPPAISGQGGHDATFRAAIALARGFALDEDTTFRLLAEHYNPRCQPPWSERELRHKAREAATKSTLPLGYILKNDRDAERAAARTQWLADDAPPPSDDDAPPEVVVRLVKGAEPIGSDAWPDLVPIGRDAPPVPFPVDVLPPWMADMVQAVATAAQVPVCMPAVFALGALSAATGARVRVCPWRSTSASEKDWIEATNLYLACVMPPGSLKSYVQKCMCAPLVRAEDELVEAAATMVARAQQRRRILERRLRMAEEAAAKANEEDLLEKLEAADNARRALDAEPPIVVPRLIVDDATPEQLKSLLADHGRLAMLSAESSLFGNVASKRYSADPNIEIILAAHPGDEVRVDRRGREEKLRDPRLTICIAVQPSVLREAYQHPAARGRGLFDRFLFAMPASNVGHRDFSRIPPAIPASVANEWDRQIRTRAHAMYHTDEPIVVDLDDEAAEMFRAWRASIEPRRRVDGDLACLGEWTSKLDGHVLRLAGLLHVAGANPSGVVSASAMHRAIVLADYFIAHAMIAFDVMGEDETAASARKVLHWITTAGHASFTRSEVNKAFRGRLDAKELDVVLGYLCDRHYLRARKEGSKGRPVLVYLVHPGIHPAQEAA